MKNFFIPLLVICSVAACKSSAVKQSFSSADSLVIHFKNEQAGVITKTNFIIQEFVKEVFESLSIKAENQQIDFSIKKGCESPLTVFADKEKIRQVMINLLDNSIKYGRLGGHIVASMYKVDEKHILIELSDDGIGIPEKHLQRIFERFYRTEGGRSRDITGSGLGLAICKHIIEAHGQIIHVRSTEGVGTTIGFTLETKKD